MKRFRKVLCVALVLLLLVASVPAVPVADLGFGITASALDANGSCGDNATYTFDSATGKLTIEGTGKINSGAFYNNKAIKEVVIGDGITEIRDKTRQHIKKQRHHFANKGTYSQGYCFSSSHV